MIGRSHSDCKLDRYTQRTSQFAVAATNQNTESRAVRLLHILTDLLNMALHSETIFWFFELLPGIASPSVAKQQKVKNSLNKVRSDCPARFLYRTGYFFFIFEWLVAHILSNTDDPPVCVRACK